MAYTGSGCKVLYFIINYRWQYRKLAFHP
jgi:hypothetical protein